MNAARHLLAALLSLVLAVMSPAVDPDQATSMRSRPNVVSDAPPPLPIPRAPVLVELHPRQPTVSERPRWPDDWPSLDPVRAGGSAATQSQGSGDVDVYIPAAPLPAGYVPDYEDPEYDPSEDEDLVPFRQYGEAQNVSQAPSDPDEAEDGPPNGNGEDDVDIPPANLPPGYVPTYEDGDEAEEDISGDLERLGAMIRDRYEGNGEAPDDGEDDVDVPPANLPPGFVPTYEDDDYDPAEDEDLRSFREMRGEAGDDDGVSDEPTDEEDIAGNRAVDEDARDDGPAADGPAPDEEPGDEDGADEGPDPFGPPPAARDAPSDDPPPTPPPPVGYRFISPEGTLLPSVLLGQPFALVLDLTPEEASIPGRLGGRREKEFIEVTVREVNGEEVQMRLYRQEEPTPDGLIRFAARDPVSIQGNWGNMDRAGSVDLGLDLDDSQGSRLVQLIAPGVTGGTSSFFVYGDPIMQGIAEIRVALDFVDRYQAAERAMAEKLLADPGVQANDELRGEVEYWLSRIGSRQSAAAQARNLLNDPLPIYQYKLPKRILDMLVTRGPNGLEVNDRTITAVDISSTLFYTRKNLDEKFGRGSAVIVPQAAIEVVEGYTLGSYSMFAHVTMGAQFWQLATGTNEFGEEASRLVAVRDIGRNILIMKAPSAVVNYLAEGRLVPSITIRSPFAGRGGGPRATPRTPRTTVIGPNNPSRVIVAPDGRILGRLSVETAGGRLPYRRGSGLSDEAIRTWRSNENPVSPSSVEVFDARIAQMDEAVTAARQRGVPEPAIKEVLDEALKKTVDEAAPFVADRLEVEISLRNERVFMGRDDVFVMQGDEFTPGIASPRQFAEIQLIDRAVLESVVAKSHLEAQGKPQIWTADEITYGRAIRRRLDAGEDLASWKGPEFGDEGITFEGLQPLFGEGDLGAIGATFNGRPLRIGRLTDRPTDWGPLPSIDTPAASTRPLSSLDDYRGWVERQAVGEQVNLGSIARPGIARVNDEAIAVVQGAGRWEGTRPDDLLDLFIPADARVPPGIEVRVLETNVPGELVRHANLLSSRGAAGTNPLMVDLSVRDVPLWNRVQVRARDVRAPTSRVGAEVVEELGRLADENVDVRALSEAISGLSPADQLSIIRDPALRKRAISGQVEVPSSTRTVDPGIDPTALGGPGGRGASRSGVEILFRSLGGSTGRVLEAYIANHGDRPVRVQTEGLVLEPVDQLDNEEQQRMDEILDAASSGKPLAAPENGGRRGAGPAPVPAAWAGAEVVRVMLDGYCLQFDGGVPTEGTVFRIADVESQAAGAPVRAILAAGRALRDLDLLHPDSRPEPYYHSIRQWALWVYEKDFDRASFEEAFVEHARKNFEAADGRWTSEVEGRVRELVPNRWSDLTAILETAGIDIRRGS